MASLMPPHPSTERRADSQPGVSLTWAFVCSLSSGALFFSLGLGGTSVTPLLYQQCTLGHMQLSWPELPPTLLPTLSISLWILHPS